MYESLSLLPAAEELFRQACAAAPASDAGYAALADLLVRYGQNLPEALEWTPSVTFSPLPALAEMSTNLPPPTFKNRRFRSR